MFQPWKTPNRAISGDSTLDANCGTAGGFFSNYISQLEHLQIIHRLHEQVMFSPLGLTANLEKLARLKNKSASFSILLC